MSQIQFKVLMGFEDELITQKYQSLVNFTTNKVGGKPDWIENKPSANPQCQLCGLTLPLIVQVYAPLDKSPYHRTLYLFGCVSPTCWNQEQSWICLRSQGLDTRSEEKKSFEKNVNMNDWCEGANNWDDEENGNTVGDLKNEQDVHYKDDVCLNSKMLELDLDESIEELSSTGATCHPLSPAATAEIEGGEDEVVTIDTPCAAQTNLVALLDQVKPVPKVPSDKLEFVSFFISVYEEESIKQVTNQESPQHFMSFDDESNVLIENNRAVNYNSSESVEKYEKTLPVHGDKLFHQFITRIQRNPGQILRYIRHGGSPLFLYPIRNIPQHCQHCCGDLVFELQLLPTLVSRLQLVGSGPGHLEFGSVFVLACQKSCWATENSVRSEIVLVQQEM